MAVWVVSMLIAAIPFVILGLILFVNRRRIIEEFRVIPNIWNACFWVGLIVMFASVSFIGWLGAGILSYHLLPHSPFELLYIPAQLIGLCIGSLSIAILLTVICARNKKKKQCH